MKYWMALGGILWLLVSGAEAGDREQEKIIYDAATRSYLHYRGDSPVAAGRIILDLAASHSEASGDAYEPSGGSLYQTSIRFGLHKFVVTHVAGGFLGSYSRTRQGEFELETYRTGPCFSIYFGDGRREGYPYVRTALLYAARTGAGNAHGLTLGLETGFTYFLSRNIALVPAIGYDHTILKPEGDTISGDLFTFQIGLASFIY